MKRNLALILSAILSLSLLLTACGEKNTGEATSTDAPQNSEQVYELKISHTATTEDPIHLGWVYLKETLEEKSNGRIQVTIYGNKQLSNSNDEDCEKVEQNIVQMTSAPTSTLSALADIKEYNIFEFPYLFLSNEDLYDVFNSEFGTLLRERLLNATGLRAYGGFSLGFCKISTNKGEVLEPASLIGNKIRTMNSAMQIAFIEALGGSATPISFGEVYTALQQGTVDGLMTTTGLYVSDKFYEVQKYMGCVDGLSLLHVPVVNNDWYEALPDDLKAIFDESMELYLDKVREYEAEYDAKALQTLADNGVIIKEYTDEERQAFIDATAHIWDEKVEVVGQETLDLVRGILGR